MSSTGAFEIQHCIQGLKKILKYKKFRIDQNKICNKKPVVINRQKTQKCQVNISLRIFNDYDKLQNYKEVTRLVVSQRFQ